MALRIYRASTTSIFTNLGFEEMILEKGIHPSRMILFLWRNTPTVNIGRHQNPWKECSLKTMEDESVTLARRYSGGGTVYQDLGCTTFSLIGSPNYMDINKNFQMVCDAIGQTGIDASKKGRNDIVVGDRKVSGSAFKKLGSGLSLHHGTILVNTDLSALGRYLTPNKLKLEAKGINSVGARVANLSEFGPVDHDSLCDALSSAFVDHYADGFTVEENELSPTSPELQDPSFLKHEEQLKNWEWRYGSTPEFSHQVAGRVDGVGIFDLNLQVTSGRVETVKLYSDCLFPDLVDRIMIGLQGAPYSPPEILSRMSQVHCDSDAEKKTLDAFIDVFRSEVSGKGEEM